MNSNSPLLLRNARVVLLDEVVEGASVLIKDQRIERITRSPKTEVNRGDRDQDLRGLTLFPGFIDVHIHGAMGVDINEANVDGLNMISKFLASQGVTTWLPTLVPARLKDYQTAVRAIDQLMDGKVSAGADEVGARPIGVHYEGPFVNIAQCGALRTAYFRSFSSVSDLDSLPVPNGSTTPVRMTTLAPEIEGGLNLIQELNQRGWIVSIGHTRADTAVLESAFNAGARHMTHFMNAMAPLHHRSPGPVGWGLSRDDVTCDVIADGVHLDPMVLKLLVKLKTSNRLTLISDSIAAAGQGDGDYRIWGETIAVKNGRTLNERGSIAGSVITMLDAVRMMKSLGVTEPELARMSSTNPARLLRIDDDCGSIEAGKRADLVALDNTGSVGVTIIGGRVAFQA